MKDQYKSELNKLCFTNEGKQNILNKLQKQTSVKHSRHLSLGSVVIICSIVLSMTVLASRIPVLSDIFSGKGYTQSSSIIGKSVTENGYTMTITDVVGDSSRLYFGVEIKAPEDVILSEDEYRFEDYDFTLNNVYSQPGSSWSVRQLFDTNKDDNILEFIFKIQIFREDYSLIGKSVDLNFNNLLHFDGTYNKELGAYEKLYDSKSDWVFEDVKLDFPDNSIKLKPNELVETLDVKAMITNVEVSPIGVTVVIQGDELKGHHEWVLKNSSDGYYGCTDFQEITLYDKEGNVISPNLGYINTPGYISGKGVGSGCSGGNIDLDEDGELIFMHTYGDLIDMDALSYIDICGVIIPLK